METKTPSKIKTLKNSSSIKKTLLINKSPNKHLNNI